MSEKLLKSELMMPTSVISNIISSFCQLKSGWWTNRIRLIFYFFLIDNLALPFSTMPNSNWQLEYCSPKASMSTH